MMRMMNNYAMWQIKLLTSADFRRLSGRAQLEYFCHLASLAPSTHNSQPWRFFIDENKNIADIYLDRTFVLPASDVAGHQATISLGCAIENFTVAAAALGIKTHMESILQPKDRLFPFEKQKNDPRYVPLARLQCIISQQNALPSDLYKAIITRKVMRAEFDPQHPIPKDVIKKLEHAADGRKTKLHIITDAVRRLCIAEFQGQADGFVINSPKFSCELGDWLLPNSTDSSLGMPGAGFGLKSAEALRIHNGLLGKAPLEPEDGLKFALGGKIGMEKSPMICCITIPKDDPLHWIEAGRSFERMFLTLESCGLSVAVHAGIVEVPLVSRIFGATLGTIRRPAVLFRTGYVKDVENKKRPHTPRLPLEKIILQKRPENES